MHSKIQLTALAMLLMIFSVGIYATANKKHIIPIQHWSTPSGLPVYFVHTSGIPMLDVAMIFRAGSGYDADHWGLAKLVNSSLNQGTNSLTGKQVASGFERLGAQYSVGMTRDMAMVKLRTLTAKQYLYPAIDIFHQVVTQPEFSKPQVDIEKKMIIASIKQQNQAPSKRARELFYSQVYKGSGYAHPLLGTINSIQRITPLLLMKFYKHYYVTHNAYLVLVGSVSNVEAHNIALQLSKGLIPGVSAAKLTIPGYTKTHKNVFSKINFKSNQTAIYFGVRGITRKNPYYFPIIVGNQILGGGAMTSLLFEKVRNQLGLTYNIRSQNDVLQYGGAYFIALSTNSSNASRALQVAKNTWLDFCKKGPSEQQVILAKRYLVRSFALNLDTNQKIVTTLAYLVFYHRPLDFLDNYKNNINQVTSRKIKLAFKRLAAKPSFTIMVGSNNK